LVRRWFMSVAIGYTYDLYGCRVLVALCSLFGLSRPEGVLENQDSIVVVCGHDESPAYKSWLRPEASFSSTTFQIHFKKCRNMSKSMTHFDFWGPISSKGGQFLKKEVVFVKSDPDFVKSGPHL